MKVYYIIMISVIHILTQDLDSIDRAKPLTVCQVLQDLQKYRGKTIEVRGNWQGDILIDKCEMNLTTGDHQWPNALYLKSTVGTGGIFDVIRTIDRNAFDKAWSELIHLQPGPVTATIVGELNAREKMEVSLGPRNNHVPNGFGHMGVFPAQIQIKAIKDIIGEPPAKELELQSIPVEELAPLKNNIQPFTIKKPKDK
jgi:hypothetical protein